MRAVDLPDFLVDFTRCGARRGRGEGGVCCRSVFNIEDADLRVPRGGDYRAVAGVRHEFHREDVSAVEGLDLRIEGKSGVGFVDVDSAVVAAGGEEGAVA